ncbi:Protein of unknown function [Cotesia congregata]|uniref:Uncharacterized protein n=1 Tax=Cotesia congregata TaxID=51543 RepID=A0A8J2HUI4_COTCN|nr:Protein of unknown function [Cotesia congregata]
MGKGKGLLEKGVHVGHTGGDNVQGKAEGKRYLLAVSENSLNSVYLLGAVHNNLPSRKLPKNGDVLNYFMFKYKILKKTVRECAAEIIDEVQEIWSDMNTPLIKHQHAIKKMEMLFTEWRNLDKSRLKKHSEFHLLKIKKFTDKLNELFDVRLKKRPFGTSQDGR